MQTYSCSPAASSTTEPDPPGAMGPVVRELWGAATVWGRSVVFVQVTRVAVAARARAGVSPL